jgi:hypothetical protein
MIVRTPPPNEKEGVIGHVALVRPEREAARCDLPGFVL